MPTYNPGGACHILEYQADQQQLSYGLWVVHMPFPVEMTQWKGGNGGVPTYAPHQYFPPQFIFPHPLATHPLSQVILQHSLWNQGSVINSKPIDLGSKYHHWLMMPPDDKICNKFQWPKYNKAIFFPPPSTHWALRWLKTQGFSSCQHNSPTLSPIW